MSACKGGKDAARGYDLAGFSRAIFYCLRLLGRPSEYSVPLIQA